MTIRTRRRTLLRGGAAAAITGPFLRLLERPAGAAGPTKRLVVFATPNGTIMDAFWPGAGCQYGEILKPLEPLKSKLLVMRGINMSSAYKTPIPADHGPDYANALTGVQRVLGVGSSRYGAIGGISLDQFLADKLGSKTKFASLQLCVGSYTTAWPLMARGMNQPIAPETSPQKVFDRLFSSVAGAGGDGAALERLRADRQSLLDYVKDDVGDLRCQLGAPERQRMDAHLQSIREVERSLSFGPKVTCAAPKVPAEPLDFPAQGKLQMDILASALACDLTRVVVLMWSGGGSDTVHTWAGVPSGGHHAIAHGLVKITADQQKSYQIKIDNWYAQQFAHLCGRLGAIAEEGSNVLDSSALLWMHEQSNGGLHTRKDMPYVLAGSCGGYFKVGRCLQVNGTSHNNLLVSLANAMDVPITTFGDPQFSTGPMAELR
jgi:hypothetical protein